MSMFIIFDCSFCDVIFCLIDNLSSLKVYWRYNKNIFMPTSLGTYDFSVYQFIIIKLQPIFQIRNTLFPFKHAWHKS